MVLDEQHREVELISDPSDHVGQLADFGMGEAGGRLVKHQELGPTDQGSGELDALHRAVGKPGALLEGVLCEAELSEDGIGLLHQLLLFLLEADACHRTEEVLLAPSVSSSHHVLDDTHVRPQGEVLEGAVHAEPGDLVRGAAQ